MQIMGFLGIYTQACIYFETAIVFVTSRLLLIRLALTIL